MPDIKQDHMTDDRGEYVAYTKKAGEAHIKKEHGADIRDENATDIKQEGKHNLSDHHSGIRVNNTSPSLAPSAEHNSPSNPINPIGLKVWVVSTCHQELLNEGEFHFTHCVGGYDSLAHATTTVHKLVRERPPGNTTSVEEFLADGKRCTRTSDDGGVVKVLGYKYLTSEDLAVAVWAEEKVVRAEGVEDFKRAGFDSGMVTYLV